MIHNLSRRAMTSELQLNLNFSNEECVSDGSAHARDGRRARISPDPLKGGKREYYPA